MRKQLQSILGNKDPRQSCLSGILSVSVGGLISCLVVKVGADLPADQVGEEVCLSI